MSVSLPYSTITYATPDVYTRANPNLPAYHNLPAKPIAYSLAQCHSLSHFYTVPAAANIRRVKMEPGDITATFVEGRWRALEKRWGSRNERMDGYEELYLLDNWEEEPEPDERRISAPIAFDTVERSRTEVKAVATDQADQIEKFLYGVWYQGRVHDALNLAEWHASCLGEGVLRCVYDPEAVEDELPLVVQALDPRTVYPNPSGRPGVDAEVIHAFKRSRREVESEWGVELERAGDGLKATGVEAWLDEEVDFVDYWRVDVEEVTEEREEQRGRGAEEQGGVLARLVEMARRALVAGGGEPGAVGGEQLGEGEEGAGEQGLPAQAGSGGAEEQEGGTRKVRRRVVTNCVVVEGQLVKEPVRMAGYKRLPFIRYAGITTPLADEDGALSVLFPITGGVRKSGAIGLVAAFNELLAMKQRIIEMFANGALITDDPKMDIDWMPGSVNYVQKGTTWNFLVPPPGCDGLSSDDGAADGQSERDGAEYHKQSGDDEDRAPAANQGAGVPGVEQYHIEFDGGVRAGGGVVCVGGGQGGGDV
jgi:hypothetical protein